MLQYGVLHITALSISFYLFGWIWGTVALIVFAYALGWILDVLGYQKMRFTDHVLTTELPNKYNNIVAFFSMKKIKFGEFKEEFYRRAILNIRGLRQIQISKFGMKFWKDIDPKIAKNQFMKCEKNIKTRDDYINYSKILIREHMDYSKPLWECHVIENYSDDTSAVIFRIHHSLSDGVGIVSMMSCVNDDKFSLRINKEFTQLNFFQRLILTVLSPFIVVPQMVREIKLCSDSKTAECNSIKGEDKSKTNIYSSEIISLEDARKCYKRFENATLNDYLLGMLSIGIKKWLIKNGVKEPSKILTLMPINLRPLPTNIHELKFGNYIFGSRNEIYLKNDLPEAIKSAQGNFKSKITSLKLITSDIFYSMLKYFPDFISIGFYPIFNKDVHLLFSNIPGSESIWKICGKEVLEFEMYPNLQLQCNLSIVCTTYNKKMRLMLLGNSELKMDPKQLMDIVNEDIKNDIKSCVNA